MPEVSWRYSALHYLNQWLTYDRRFHEALAGDDEGKKRIALTKAAAFYRISRNLPEEYDVGKGFPRYGPVLNVIDNITPATFHGVELIPTLMGVRDAISSRYGNLGVLSLTTKLLWLKIRSPIIIYDGNARRALKVQSGNIEAYYSAWRTMFEGCRSEIITACASLRKVVEFSVDPHEARAGVNEWSCEPWFQERVLDMYLWNLGAPS